ncbi:hypothetical protein ENBRE01_2526 [Enteropsectra breve]|nr:hypothetical protein ENBRE01_2526 [Enteropsectra breve]
MRILLLFAVNYAKSALNAGGNVLQYCSPQQCPDDRAECFSLMLDGFKGKDAIADVNDKRNPLIFTNQKDEFEVLELYLKSERLKECIPLLKYYCDCFAYDLRTSNGILLCSGCNKSLSYIYKENGRWLYPKGYGMLFRKNYLKLIEDNVDVSCYYRREYTEKASVPESKEDIVDIPKYEPESCFCKIDEGRGRDWRSVCCQRTKPIVIALARLLFILSVLVCFLYIVAAIIKIFSFSILGIGCRIFVS